MSNDMRVCNTSDLKFLVHEADRLGLSRVADLPDNIDLAGNHVLSLVLFGHNMDDSSTPLHHRTQVLIKVLGTNDPAVAYLDVTDSNWNALDDSVKILQEPEAP